jgi:hypothetical protein
LKLGVFLQLVIDTVELVVYTVHIEGFAIGDDTMLKMVTKKCLALVLAAGVVLGNSVPALAAQTPIGRLQAISPEDVPAGIAPHEVAPEELESFLYNLVK